MLGITRRSDAWCWTAVGKHPAAADYIRLAGGSPLIDALAVWMTNGYQAWLEGGSPSCGHHSWRFWLRGGDHRTLICGLLCDSSDRIGRPFPFALLGEGKIKGWEKHWTRLCMDLETTWGALEYMAAHRYDDIKALADALKRITTPALKQKENEPDGADLSEMPAPSAADPGSAELNEGLTVFRLDQDHGNPAALAAQIIRRRLGDHSHGMPRAVFLGGPPQQAYLAVLRHPLSSADFVALWRL